MTRTTLCWIVAITVLAPGFGWTRASAAEVRVLEELAYKHDAAPSATGSEPCRLDLYLPDNDNGFATLVWLHGGGLTGGSKSTETGRRVARHLAAGGIAVAMVEYRLNPAATFPAYIEDAAAAFAWVKTNIVQQGGDPGRVYLGGHSAGAYLSLMVALDKKYLAAHGLGDEALAGLVALSSQTTTHFTVREERGLGERLVIDDAAPLYHVRRLPYPVLIFTAANDMALRVEENRLLAAALREAKCEGVIERVWPGRDHGTVFSHMGRADDPVAAEVIQFVRGGAAQAAP